MDINSGHVITEEELKHLALIEQERYMPVPDGLNRFARRALAGQQETTINLRSNSRLATFAREKRKEKRKAQKKARAVNR